jgi:predicted dehydrogenase
VSRADATGVSVIGSVEDVCNARLTFANGAVANLTASRLALKTERKIRLFSSDAYVSIDFQKRYGMVAHRGGNLDAIRQVVAEIRSGKITDLSQVNFTELVQVQELQIDDDTEPLRAELEAFIDAVEGKAAPAVSGRDGLAAVEVAERIVAAMGDATLG